VPKRRRACAARVQNPSIKNSSKIPKFFYASAALLLTGINRGPRGDEKADGGERQALCRRRKRPFKRLVLFGFRHCSLFSYFPFPSPQQALKKLFHSISSY
jgi:hypothetical protein